MESIPGINENKIKLFKSKGIKDIDDLKRYIDDPELALHETTKIYLKYHDVRCDKIQREVIDRLNIYLPKTLVCVGSYRRGKSILKDVDYISFEPLNKMIEKIRNNSDKYSILDIYSHGEKRVSIILRLNFILNCIIKIDLFKVERENEPFALLHHTGSKNFNIRVRAHAKKKGYILNQYNLTRLSDGKIIKGLKSERDILEYIGITYKKPEERSE